MLIKHVIKKNTWVKLEKVKSKMDALYLIRFVLSLVPFTFLLFVATTVYGYTSSKIIGLNIVIIASVIILLFNLQKDTFVDFICFRYRAMIKDRLFISVSIFVLLALLSALNSKHIFTSFVGYFTRWEGFMTLFSIYTYFVLANIFFSKETMRRFSLNTIIISIVLFVIVLISVYLGIKRTSSIMGNPIAVGQFFLLSLFFILVLFNQTAKAKEKILYILLAIILCIGIVLSETRGIFVGFVIGFVALLIVWIFSKKKLIFNKISLKNASIIILTCIIIFSTIFFSTKKSEFWQKIPMINRFANTNLLDPSTRSRIINNKISFDMFTHMGSLKNTLIGLGPESYLSKWFEHYDPVIQKYEEGKMDHAHNFVFDLLITRGILGTLMFFYILFLSIKWAKKINFYVFSGTIFVIVSYFIQNLFAFDFYPTNILLLMIFTYLIKENEYAV